MTPNEINEAIAKSLGVKTEKCSCGDFLRDTHTRQHIKDYYSSLDACAEFEASFSTELSSNYWTAEIGAYIEWLYEVCSGHDFDPEEGIVYRYLVLATAPQRCEAYLKMKGLWKV